MKYFTTFELRGIIGSTALLAFVLFMYNENFLMLAQKTDATKQEALVTQTEETELIVSPLETLLRDAHTSDGELVELVTEDTRLGTEGAFVTDGDTVVVHYVGATKDGVKFDSSYERGEPFIFTVGAGRVIEGWEKGLIGMRVGGQRVLVIPSHMAYGNRHVGIIEPNSMLLFAVELLEIR